MTRSTPNLGAVRLIRTATLDCVKNWRFVFSIGVLWFALNLGLYSWMNSVDMEAQEGSAEIWLWVKLTTGLLATFVIGVVLAIAWHRLVLRKSRVSESLKSHPIARYGLTVAKALVPFLIIAGILNVIGDQLFTSIRMYEVVENMPKPFQRIANGVWLTLTLNWFPHVAVIFGWLVVGLSLPQVAMGRPANVFQSLRFSLRNVLSLLWVSSLTALIFALLDFYGGVWSHRLLSNAFGIDLAYQHIKAIISTTVAFLSSFVSLSLLSRVSEAWRPISDTA
ncbi:hypothetical protein [Shimia sp.]|uniref:hypothetical protein n=1 Tax=Shimia sp. TaxID=1954381 RepID=UPI003B8B481C